MYTHKGTTSTKIKSIHSPYHISEGQFHIQFLKLYSCDSGELTFFDVLSYVCQRERLTPHHSNQFLPARWMFFSVTVKASRKTAWHTGQTHVLISYLAKKVDSITNKIPVHAYRIPRSLIICLLQLLWPHNLQTRLRITEAYRITAKWHSYTRLKCDNHWDNLMKKKTDVDFVNSSAM